MAYQHIFIEGIPGSGKSTLATALSRKFPGYRLYREGELSPLELAWCSYMTPVEYEQTLHTFSALKAEIHAHSVSEGGHVITAYTQIQTEDRSFYDYMSQYEIYAGRRDNKTFQEIVLCRFATFFAAERTMANGSIFECSLFQNIIEELMLFALYNEMQIKDFYRTLFSRMDMKTVCLIRLKPADVGKSIQQIRRERVNEQGEEVWYQMMLDYLNASPYGNTHPFLSFQDVLAHFERRTRFEDMVSAGLFQGRLLELPSRTFSLDTLCAALSD